MANHEQGQGQGQGPLAGKVVVDLSRALAGPHATMMLADMGARVIKVEPPGTGDDSRGWGPPFVGPEDQQESTYFFSCNRNKESIQLDLKSADGLCTLERLVARADVLVENFRTGVLDRLGIPISRMHEINPGLVVLSITGFGHDGPEAGRAGYDQIAQGEAGLMSLTGPGPGEPTRVGVPIGDLLAGMYGAFGVVSALVEREQSGTGTTVRTSLLSALVGVHAFQGTRYTVAGQVPHPIGNHHPSIAPYGAFQAADSVIQVAVGNQAQWHAFCNVTGIAADDADFATNGARVANRQQLIETIEKCLVDEPAAVWLQRLRKAGVPSGAVRTLEEVYEWEQTQSQGLVVQVEHPTVGSIRLPGPAVRMEDPLGASVLRGDHLAPPTLGQHDREIREWLDG